MKQTFNANKTVAEYYKSKNDNNGIQLNKEKFRKIT